VRADRWGQGLEVQTKVRWKRQVLKGLEQLPDATVVHTIPKLIMDAQLVMTGACVRAWRRGGWRLWRGEREREGELCVSACGGQLGGLREPPTQRLASQGAPLAFPSSPTAANTALGYSNDVLSPPCSTAVLHPASAAFKDTQRDTPPSSLLSDIRTHALTHTHSG